MRGRREERIYTRKGIYFSRLSWAESILIMSGWLRSGDGSAAIGNSGEDVPSISSFSAKALSKADLATLVTHIIRTTAHNPK